MGFAAGSVSFRRYLVTGKHPKAVDQALLDALSEHALRPSDVGVPEEVEYGWCGGRHVLDGTFSFDNNVFGDALHFALRIDTNRVPSELKKAYQLMEEEAAAANNPSGFISKSQKRDAKDTVRRKLDDEARSGRFRRSKLLPMLWDFPSQTLLCAASSSAQEKLMEIFERTFGLELEPISAGSLGARLLEQHGKRRDYEDLRPTRFVTGPDGDNQPPEYPWASKGDQAKDFLGNEFLLWLWHEADARSAIITTKSGDVTIYFDRALDLDCAYGQTGRDTFRGDGPSRMPEALDALRSGKVPRKAGLILDAIGNQFTLNFNAETFALGSLKLPDVEEAETPRVLFEERITMLRDFCQCLDNLYAAFLKTRTSGGWESHVATMRRWIMQSTRPVAAVA
jgi:hypothetical protein